MDPSSIIVQVNRPDTEPLNGVSSYTSDNGNVQGSDATKTSYEAQPVVVKRKSRFLSSLLCCFGNKSSARTPVIADIPVSEANDQSVPIKTDPPAEPIYKQVSVCSDKYLLPDRPELKKHTIVIDLDETLVHSSFKPVDNADFIVPVEIDGTVHEVYVLKRPHVDEFLQRMGEKFDCVLFTASLAKYADPVADLLDPSGVFSARLFRESCVFHRGNYVKDLSRLGRPLDKVLIVDNSPASYIFHPDNAVAVTSWFDDLSDRELLDIAPLLEKIADQTSVYEVLKNSNDIS